MQSCGTALDFLYELKYPHSWLTNSEKKKMEKDKGICRKLYHLTQKLLHALFYKQRFFFNSVSLLLNFSMNWASNVA